MFDLTKFLKSKQGKILMSIIWGFGLSALFRKVCSDRKCIVYKAPNPGEIMSKVYGHGGKCYKYMPETSECSGKTISG